MCDVSDGFRLCTCASDAADWTLTRGPVGGDTQLDGMMIRGLTLSPSEDVAAPSASPPTVDSAHDAASDP